MENNEQKLETQLAKTQIESKEKGLVLRNLEDMFRFAQYVQKSGLAPSSFKTPESILVAVQTGAELGLTPMRALQSICVVNGNARIWGDTPLALVKQSGFLEYIKETIEGEGDQMKAVCIVKRKNEPEQVREFSVIDAKQAGLWAKQGTWHNYPKRMMQMRARSLALRDIFPDALAGATIQEEYDGVEIPQQQDTAQVLAREDRKQVESVVVKTEGEIIAEKLDIFTDKLIEKINKEAGLQLNKEKDLDLLDKISEVYFPDAVNNVNFNPTIQLVDEATTRLDQSFPQEVLNLLPEKPMTLEEVEKHAEEILSDKPKRGRKKVEKTEEAVTVEHGELYHCNKCGKGFDKPAGTAQGKKLCPKCLSTDVQIVEENIPVSK